jgi:DnaA-homolog protein
MSGVQLPLQIRLNDNATFANFYTAENAQAVSLLQSKEAFVYLWSTGAAGKTHLLQAACHQHLNTMYLPLAEHSHWSVDIFEGLEQYAVVCLDDVQSIAGDQNWETALFNLFNRLRERHACLYITANASPTSLPIQLPDLASRLSWGVSLRLRELTDAEKVKALSMRARARGFTIADEVANYLLKHCPRDLHSLFAILDQLDDASLQAQRRISIPFIKQCLQI